jgi:hypothetical protein
LLLSKCGGGAVFGSLSNAITFSFAFACQVAKELG